MNRYKPYTEYKDSGVDWIRKIPAHWGMSKVKWEYDAQLGKMVQPDPKNEDDKLVPYHKSISVQWDKVSEIPPEKMWASKSEIAKFSIRSGDLLICEGGDAGRAAIYFGKDKETIIQNSLHRVRPLKENKCELLLGLMRVVKQSGWMDVLCNKSTIVHFTSEKLGDLAFPEIPNTERDIILSAIAEETQHIDALIDKKITFLELIKEKILALVMNEQINGFGEFEKLKRVTQVISRPAPLVDNDEYIPLGLYNRGRGLFHKPVTLGKDMGDSTFFYVEEGDLILSGQFAWEGAVTMASENENGCVVSHRYPVIRGTSVATEYLLALFMSDFGDFLLNESSRGAAGRNRPLNINLLLNEKIRIPSIDVQNEIRRLMYLRSQAEVKVKNSIELLKERRSAFITAAVTGQIDLREESK